MKKKYYLFEMNTLSLNIVSMVLFFALLLLTGNLLQDQTIDLDYLLGKSMLYMFPYFVFHEILHSISYVLHGADFKNITYGAHIEKGLLCCLCKQNVSKRNILISLLYPFIFIGIITYIIGIIFNMPLLMLLSIMNISGCSGDLLMFYSLSRIKNFEYSEYDNPTAFGLYTEEDLSNKKLPGLKYVGTKNELERKDLKKVTISKTSIISFIIIELLGVLYLFI
ncbi:MAG: DUF3267 domain-containing protein [Bacilli bacterium]|nr:DUF3267 domain-containing protein [Bacilli bacterium]